MEDDFLLLEGLAEPIKVSLDSISEINQDGNIVRVKIDCGITFPIILDTEFQAKQKFNEIKEKVKNIYSKQRNYREEAD